MQDIIRQIFVVLSIIGTIVVNGLANALPFNGVTTGQVSDRFQVYFVPAGYVFSIWGLIYIGLAAHGIFQALPSNRANPRLRRCGWWLVLAGIANSAWMFLWHYGVFVATLVVMLVLLGSLIVIYQRLGIGRVSVSRGETLFAWIPFSLYLGWITVATIANASVVLAYLSWSGFGLSAEFWMVVMLVVVVAIVSLMSITRRDTVYAAVILWALAGIGVKHSGVDVVSPATWIAFGITAAVAIGGRFLPRPTPIAK